MLLHSVHLTNIRSYTTATIEFRSGNTLLSGDIGAGKSTILHAVEFALFGALRGVLSGETLLRSGEREGRVTLSFSIQDQPITISRSLKRTKNGIVQDSGSITIQGITQALTPTELKSKILQLLGYPPELLTKSKGLIYRYTVYTPQEDMKRILFDDPDARLNTIRTVFTIDKYQLILENTKTVLRSLNEHIRHLEGRVADVSSKQELLSRRREEEQTICAFHAQARTHLTKARANVKDLQTKADAFQEDLHHLSEFRKRKEILEAEQRSLLTQRVRLEKQILIDHQSLQQLEAPLPPQALPTSDDLAANIEEVSTSLKRCQEAIYTTLSHLAKTQELHAQSTSLSNRISTLSTCPTCLQSISENHRTHILSQEHTQATALQSAIQQLQESLGTENSRKESLEKHQNLLRETHASLKQVIAIQRHHTDLLQRIESSRTTLTSIDARISETTAQKSAISRKICALENTEQACSKAKEALALAQKQEREAAVNEARIGAEQDAVSAAISELSAEISEKTKLSHKLSRLKIHTRWIQDTFIPLVSLIEQHVLATVYHHFNDAFTMWFATLIEDNLISVRLDELFSPIINQNGYDISAEHLSGGEKTALALAYRLALNKVIHDLHTTISTRDLLILDEPTDGFSTEQLDRVRDVLHQLPVAQCIIVSHESKMESFVDHIIMITKEGHVSKIA